VTSQGPGLNAIVWYGLFTLTVSFFAQPAADDTTTELVPKFSVTVMRVPNGTDGGDVTVQQHGSHKGVGFEDGAKPSGTQPAAETLLRHSVAMPAACDEATVLASALSALKTAVEMDRLDAWTPSGSVPSAQDGACYWTPTCLLIESLLIESLMIESLMIESFKKKCLDRVSYKV
jgi:hypothetical protein